MKRYRRDLFLLGLAGYAMSAGGEPVASNERDYESMAGLLVDAVCTRFVGPLFFKRLAKTKEGRQFVVQEANQGLFKRERREGVTN